MKSLKQFDFASRQKGTYDWDKILDGTIWQLVKGTDFESEVDSFGMLIRTAAERRSKKVKLKLDKKEGMVTVQAEDMTPAEVEATKAKIAARLSKEKEKRAAKKAAEANGQTTPGGVPSATPAVTQTEAEATDAPAPAPTPKSPATPKPVASKPGAVAGKK